MLRVPKRSVNQADLDPFLREIDWVEVWTAGDNLIIDICRNEVEVDDEWHDGSGQLAALAPLRADVLSGDLRLFYLLWLTAVQDEIVPDDELEPLPGIGPLTGALEAFPIFFGIDSDLVEAAAELGEDGAAMSESELRNEIAAISAREKDDLLLRVVEGDAHVAVELRNRVRRKKPASAAAAHRSAGMLRMRAKEIAEARERAEAGRREAERRREAAEAANARRARLEILRKRGANSIWREIEQEIGRRNPAGYDNAMRLLSDVQAWALEEGDRDDFDRRLGAIRARHERKGKFIERLAELGGDADERMI
jgi:hypothetical protein